MGAYGFATWEAAIRDQMGLWWVQLVA